MPVRSPLDVPGNLEERQTENGPRWFCLVHPECKHGYARKDVSPSAAQYPKVWIATVRARSSQAVVAHLRNNDPGSRYNRSECLFCRRTFNTDTVSSNSASFWNERNSAHFRGAHFKEVIGHLIKVHTVRDATVKCEQCHSAGACTRFVSLASILCRIASQFLFLLTNSTGRDLRDSLQVTRRRTLMVASRAPSPSRETRTSYVQISKRSKFRDLSTRTQFEIPGTVDPRLLVVPGGELPYHHHSGIPYTWSSLSRNPFLPRSRRSRLF
jgi:hypothetical protein